MEFFPTRPLRLPCIRPLVQLGVILLASTAAAGSPPDYYALGLDGNDYLTVPYSTDIPSTVFSVSAWIRTTASGSLTSRAYVASTGEDDVTDLYAWGLQVESSGVLAASLGTDPDTYHLYVSTTNVVDAAWHHVVMTRDGADVLRLYVDGTQVLEVIGTPDPSTTVTQDLTIGCTIGESGAPPSDPNEFFPGDIDEVTLWSRPLLPTEVADLVAGNLPSLLTGLVGHWPMEEGTGQACMDFSGAGNDAVLGDTSAAESSDPTWTLSFEVTAEQVVRLGTPPNPSALMPDPAGGPTLGNVWSPYVDHSTFAPSAFSDVLFLVFSGTLDVDLGVIGTLLCNVTGAYITFPATPGTSFNVPFPNKPAFAGLSFCTQAASFAPAGLQLTNALDIVLGTP